MRIEGCDVGGGWAGTAATVDRPDMHVHGASTGGTDSGPGSVVGAPSGDPARVACAPPMRHANGSPMPIINAASPRDRYRPPRAEPKLWGAAQTYWSRSPTQDDIYAAPGTHHSSTNSPSARRREVLGDDVMLGVQSTPHRARELAQADRPPPCQP